jgi:hypothetical protein
VRAKQARNPRLAQQQHRRGPPSPDPRMLYPVTPFSPLFLFMQLIVISCCKLINLKKEM